MAIAGDNVEGVLKRLGPLESDRLSKALVDAQCATSCDSARKLIERARKADRIRSTLPVRFDKSVLYYHDDHNGAPYARAVRKLLPNKPALNRVFKTILANKGWITFGQIGKASACLPPGDTSRAGGRASLEKVVEELTHLGLVVQVLGEIGFFQIGPQFGDTDTPLAVFKTRVSLEQMFLEGLRDWTRRCHLLAFNSHTIRTNEYSGTEFNQAIWDMHGPLYCGPFATNPTLKRESVNPAFLVAEVVGFRQYTQNDAEGTIERLKNIGYRWKSVSFMPIVLAPSYSAVAWQQLRSIGVIALTLREVFGRNVEELVRRFWTAIQTRDVLPETLDNIESSLEIANGTCDVDALNGLVGNLKGILFELIVALAYRATGHDTVLRKRTEIPTKRDQCEIDIVATRGESTCILVECKGRKAGYEESRDEVARHFSRRCRIASHRDGWNVTKRYATVQAVFVTSGTLHSEAQQYARDTKKSHGIECSVMTRNELLAFLKTAAQPRLVDIVKKYY